MKKMTAAVFKGNGILEIETVDTPDVKEPTEVLVKVKSASICGSDIHGLHVPPGQYIKPGVVMGHEFYGYIEAVGEKAGSFKVGDCVVVNPCVPCGECWECRHDMKNLCMNPYHYGQTGDGGFAEYVVVEAGQLYKLPTDISPDIAPQTEPLACVLSGILMVKPTPVDSVLLYGAGPIGLTFIRVLKMYGVRRLAVCAKGEKRISQAKECGADIVINSEKELPACVLEREWGGGADVVIDAVGTGRIMEEAVRILNSHGRLLLFGLNFNESAEVPPAVFTRKELKVCGALGKAFTDSITLLQDERLGIDKIVSHRFALKDIKTALELLRNKEACRVIIYPDEADLPSA